MIKIIGTIFTTLISFQLAQAHWRIAHDEINNNILNTTKPISTMDSLKKKEIIYNSDNSIQKVIHRNFIIKESPQKEYVANYQNNKPWQGYFPEEIFVDNIPLISYYEDGILKYKYYFEFLEQIEDSSPYTYTHKSTYKDGKIIDGKTFIQIPSSGFAEILHKNAEPIAVDINLFGMHAFERLSAKLESNKIIVTQFSTKINLEIEKENDALVGSIFLNNELIQKSSTNYSVEEGSPNSITIYYLEDNQIKKTSRPSPKAINDYDIQNSIIGSFYMLMPLQYEKDMKHLISEIADFIQNNENLNSLNDMDFITDLYKKGIISSVYFDNNKKINYGISITQNADKTILLEGYIDNAMKQKTTVKNLEELIKNNNEVVNKLSHDLLNN